MNRSHFVRGATLSGYVKAAQEVGLDPRAMFGRTGLKYECLKEPDLLIAHDSFLRLLELSAETSGCHDFGARASIARGIPDLGAVSLLLREAETIEDALHTILSRLYLHGNAAIISFDNHPNEPFVSFRIAASPGASTLQATEFCACGFVQIVRWLIGPNWRPQLVCFSHASTGHTRLQRAFFQAPVRYEQSTSGILIDRQTLQRTVETSAPFLRRQAKGYLEGSLPLKPVDFSAKVAAMIAQMLPRDSCSADNVATALGIDRRTLSRRLERDGQSYASLLQRARCEIAQQLATDMSLSLTDAAEVAGFQNLSSFSRWFRSTFGYSATQWRQDTAQPSSHLRSASRRSRSR
ncbi:MAG TPA: AraC family transcriptional regulator [Steroidobacteraceae bacterium]|jgi:AraC-like DNA-binding protein